jgi:hypothetical protein
MSLRPTLPSVGDDSDPLPTQATFTPPCSYDINTIALINSPPPPPRLFPPAHFPLRFIQCPALFQAPRAFIRQLPRTPQSSAQRIVSSAGSHTVSRPFPTAATVAPEPPPLPNSASSAPDMPDEVQPSNASAGRLHIRTAGRFAPQALADQQNQTTPLRKTIKLPTAT